MSAGLSVHLLSAMWVICVNLRAVHIGDDMLHTCSSFVLNV